MPKRSCQNLLYISSAIYRNVRREQTYDVDIPAPRIRSSVTTCVRAVYYVQCRVHHLPALHVWVRMYLPDHEQSEGFIYDYLFYNLSQSSVMRHRRLGNRVIGKISQLKSLSSINQIYI